MLLGRQNASWKYWGSPIPLISPASYALVCYYGKVTTVKKLAYPLASDT